LVKWSLFKIKIHPFGGDALGYDGFVSVALLFLLFSIINNLKFKRKEPFMKQIKKVKIAIKFRFNLTISTLWTIGTSIVAGDVL
jgi:hypothetical protein